jgi:hypothetical protein
MRRKSQSLAIVRDEPKPDLDSPERFARKCRHLSINGQPLESKLFRLRAEKESDPLRAVS